MENEGSGGSDNVWISEAGCRDYDKKTTWKQGIQLTWGEPKYGGGQ